MLLCPVELLNVWLTFRVMWYRKINTMALSFYVETCPCTNIIIINIMTIIWNHKLFKKSTQQIKHFENTAQ